MNSVACGLLSGDPSFFECCYQWVRLCCSGWRAPLLVSKVYRKYQYTSQFWNDISNSQASISSIVVAGTSIATRFQRETHERDEIESVPTSDWRNLTKKMTGIRAANAKTSQYSESRILLRGIIPNNYI